MNPAPEQRWSPSRELLAAFADGELDGCEDSAKLRRRIEDWLLLHPEARAEANAQTELSSMLAATAPREPDASVWAKVWPRIERGCKTKSKRRPASLMFGAVLAAGAAAAVLLLVLDRAPEAQAPSSRQQLVEQQETPAPGNPQLAVLSTPPKDLLAVVPISVPRPHPAGFEGGMAVLPVATNDDVEIIRVVGADPRMLVVGRLPWSSPMPLLKAHEVQVKPPYDCMTCMTNSTPILMMPLSDDPDDNN